MLLEMFTITRTISHHLFNLNRNVQSLTCMDIMINKVELNVMIAKSKGLKKESKKLN